MECIILTDNPACGREVAGKTIPQYTRESLLAAGFTNIVTAGGGGTDGGSLKRALSEVTQEDVFVIYGHIYHTLDYAAMLDFHRAKGAQATLALKKMFAFSRYCSIGVDRRDSQVSWIAPPEYCESGYASAGVFIVSRSEMMLYPDEFSLWEDYFQAVVYSGYLCGFVSDGYFMDISDEEASANADYDFRHGRHKPFDTLFLDRDGVINVQIPESYVTCPEEFEWIDGVFEAMEILAGLFSRIFIVSNQRGVGLGLMTMNDLKEVNGYMTSEIESHGGRIDRIYSCTDHDKNSFNRKPNPGMALKIREDYPEIDYTRCFMVGDTSSDIRFGNNAGIPAVLVGTKYAYRDRSELDIVGYYDNLLEFAKSLRKR